MANDIQVDLGILITANTAALDKINKSVNQLNTNIGKLARGHGVGASAASGHTKQLQLLNNIYIKNSSTINRQYLSSVSGLRRAYRALNDEFDVTFRRTKTGIKSFNDAGMGFYRASIKADMFARTVNNMSRDLVNMGKNAQWTGRQLMVGITAPLLAIGTQGIRKYMELDKAFVKTAKLLDGDVSRSMNSLRKDAANLSAEFGNFNQIDVSGVQNRFAAIGSSLKQIQELTKLTLQFDVLGDLGDLEKSGTLVETLYRSNARALGSYSLAIKETEKNLKTFNLIEDKTSLNMEDIAESLPKVATLFRQMGIDMGKGTALIAAGAQGGIPAVEVANALKTAFTRLPAALAQVETKGTPRLAGLKNILKEINAELPNGKKIDWFKADGSFMGLDAILSVARGWSTLNDEQRSVFNYAAFGATQNTRLTEIMVALSNSLDPATAKTEDFAKALGLAADEAQAADRWAKGLQTFFNSDSTKLNQQIQQLTNTGMALAKQLVPTALMLLANINKLVGSFNALPQSTKDSIVKFGLLAAAMGPVMYAGSQLIILFGQGFRYAIQAPLSAMTKVTHRFHKAGEEVENFNEELAKLQSQYMDDRDTTSYRKGIDDLITKQRDVAKATNDATDAVKAQSAAQKAATASGDIYNADPGGPFGRGRPTNRFFGYENPKAQYASNQKVNGQLALPSRTTDTQIFERAKRMFPEMDTDEIMRLVMNESAIKSTAKTRAAGLMADHVKDAELLKERIESLRYASDHLEDFYKIFDADVKPEALGRFIKMTDEMGLAGHSFAARLQAILKGGGIESLDFITGNGKVKKSQWESALANLGAGASKFNMPGGAITAGSFPNMMRALRDLVGAANDAPAGKSGIKAPRMLTNNVLDEVFGTALATTIDTSINFDKAEAKIREETPKFKKWRAAVNSMMSEMTGSKFELGKDSGRSLKGTSKEWLELVMQQVADDLGFSPKELSAVTRAYIGDGKTYQGPRTYANDLARNQFTTQSRKLVSDNLGLDVGAKAEDVQKRSSEIMRDVRKQMGIGQTRTKLATKLGVNDTNFGNIMRVATVEGIDRAFLETFDLPKEFWDAVGYRLWGGASKQDVAKMIGTTLDANQKSQFNTAVSRAAKAVAEEMGMGGVITGGFATEVAAGGISERRYRSKKILSDRSSVADFNGDSTPALKKYLTAQSAKEMRSALETLPKPMLDVIEESLIMEIRDTDLIEEMLVGKGLKGKNKREIAELVSAAVTKSGKNGLGFMDELVGATKRKVVVHTEPSRIESLGTRDEPGRKTRPVDAQGRPVRKHFILDRITDTQNKTAHVLNDPLERIANQMEEMGLFAKPVDDKGTTEYVGPLPKDRQGRRHGPFGQRPEYREVWLDEDGKEVTPVFKSVPVKRKRVTPRRTVSVVQPERVVPGLVDAFEDFREPDLVNTSAGRRARKEMPHEPGSNVFATPHGLKEFDEIDKITDAVKEGRKSLDIEINRLTGQLTESMTALSSMERFVIENQIKELTDLRDEISRTVDTDNFMLDSRGVDVDLEAEKRRMEIDARDDGYRRSRDSGVTNLRRTNRQRRRMPFIKQMPLTDDVLNAISELADDAPGEIITRKRIAKKMGKKSLASKAGGVFSGGFGTKRLGGFLQDRAKKGTGIAAMIPGVQQAGSVLTFMAPLLPIILAIAAAIVLIIKNWKKVSEGLKAGVKRFGDGLKQMKEAIGQVIGAIIGPFQAMWARINGDGKDKGKKFSDMWKNVGKIINFVLAGLAPMVKLFAAVAKPLFTAIAVVIEILIHAIRGVIALLTGDFSGAWDALKSIIGAFGQGVRAIFGDIIAFIIKGLLLIPNTVADVAIKAMGIMGKIAGPIGAPFRAAQKSMKEAKKEFNGYADSFIDMLQGKGEYDKNRDVNIQQIEDIRDAVNAMRKEALKAGAGEDEATKVADAYKKALKANLAKGMDMSTAKAAAKKSVQKMLDTIKTTTEEGDVGSVPSPGTDNIDGDAGAAAADEFMSAFRSKLQDMQSKWKDAIMDSFNEWADNEIETLEKTAQAAEDAADAKIQALDDQAKAEAEAQYQREAVARREEMLAKKKHNSLVYGRERDKALYEGRVDDAKALEIERVVEIADEKKEEQEFEEDYNDHMVELQRERQKETIEEEKKGIQERLKIEREAKEKLINLRREQLEAQLDAFLEYAPKTAAAAREMQAQMLAALGGATDGYGKIGAMQAMRWASSWAEAMMRAKAQLIEDAYWTSAAGAIDVANGDNNSAIANVGGGSASPGGTPYEYSNGISGTEPGFGDGGAGPGGDGGVPYDPNPFDLDLAKMTTFQDIKATQELLNSMGYDAGEPDGRLGPKTKAAIYAFNSEAWTRSVGEYINMDGSLTPLGFQTMLDEALVGGTKFAAFHKRVQDILKYMGVQLLNSDTAGGGDWGTPSAGGGGGAPLQFHDGGQIGGTGDIPAVLEGGEFVINKRAASALGPAMLARINAAHTMASSQRQSMLSNLTSRVGGIRKFHMGGLVDAANLTSGAPRVSGGATDSGFNLALHFDGGFFGTDREIEKLAATIEKRIAPKLSRAKGFENRKINSI